MTIYGGLTKAFAFKEGGKMTDKSGFNAVEVGLEIGPLQIQEAVKENPKKIVLNLTNVPYVDSPGIGELVYNYNSVKDHGSNLVLLNLTNKIRQLLVIAKLVTVFEIFDNEDQAVA